MGEKGDSMVPISQFPTPRVSTYPAPHKLGGGGVIAYYGAYLMGSVSYPLRSSRQLQPTLQLSWRGSPTLP